MASGQRERRVAEELPPVAGVPSAGLQVGLCPIFSGAFLAGANGSQEIEAVDSGRVAVVKINLQGVVADGVRRLCRQLRFVHGEQRRTRRRGRDARGIFFFQLLVFLLPLRLFLPLVVAHGAGTFLAEIGEVVVAGVAVGPSYVDSFSGRHVHFHVGRFSSRIDGNGHGSATLFLCQRGSADSGQAAVFEFHAAVGKI